MELLFFLALGRRPQQVDLDGLTGFAPKRFGQVQRIPHGLSVDGDQLIVDLDPGLGGGRTGLDRGDGAGRHHQPEPPQAVGLDVDRDSFNRGHGAPGAAVVVCLP